MRAGVTRFPHSPDRDRLPCPAQEITDAAARIYCGARERGAKAGGCGICLACEKIAAGTHPDVIAFDMTPKGLTERVRDLITTLGYPRSISETFLRRNQNQSIEENLRVLDAIKKRADDAKIDIVVYVSMAFGNPYGDPWSETQIAAAIREILARGIRAISLADTVGIAGPELIKRVVEAAKIDNYELGEHVHSARANAAEKILAAYDTGCRRFDSAIGGLGGCPFAQDALVGNIPTESVIEALGRHGLNFQMDDIERVVALNREIGGRFA